MSLCPAFLVMLGEATFSNTALSGEITPAPVLPSLEAIAKSSRTFGRADVDKTGSP